MPIFTNHILYKYVHTFASLHRCMYVHRCMYIHGTCIHMCYVWLWNLDFSLLCPHGRGTCFHVLRFQPACHLHITWKMTLLLCTENRWSKRFWRTFQIFQTTPFKRKRYTEILQVWILWWPLTSLLWYRYHVHQGTLGCPSPSIPDAGWQQKLITLSFSLPKLWDCLVVSNWINMDKIR